MERENPRFQACSPVRFVQATVCYDKKKKKELVLVKASGGGGGGVHVPLFPTKFSLRPRVP